MLQEQEKLKDDRLKGKEKERETGKEKDRETDRKRRDSEKEREIGRGKDRDAGRKARAEREPSRGRERKFRENRPSSPTSGRRSPYAKRRSRSR